MSFVIPAFADSFDVTFNADNFQTGDTVVVSGEIFEMGMPIIAMSVYDPDGKILSANNLEITNGTFSKSILLVSPFYEKSGKYEIKFDYGQISENHDFTIDNGDLEPESIVEEIIEPEILLLSTEKLQYTDGDIVEILGHVSVLESPTVLIGIYDPFGMPAGFYFGQINSDLEFSTSFLVKDGVNFRTDGTYFVKAHYDESEVKSFFEYNKILKEKIISETIQTESEIDIIEKEIIVDDVIDNVIETPVEEIIPEIIEDKVVNETDELIPDVITVSFEEKITESEIIDDTKDESSQKEIIQEKKQNKPIQSKKTKQTNEKNNSEIKQDNLSVEDIELGKLLNQINLECDSSQFVDMISYYDGMGPALYRLCKFDSSLNFFNESLIKDHNDVEVLVNKGSTLGKLGDFTKAILYYDLALEIDPDFLPAKNNKANALATMGNLDDAILIYKEILNENPNSTTTQKNLKTAISLKPETQKVEKTTKSEIVNAVYSEPTVFEKPELIQNEKQKPENFIDQINSAFSSLGMLFGFLN